MTAAAAELIGAWRAWLTQFLRDLTLKREITVGDIATSAAVVVAVMAAWFAWSQLRGLSRQTRATVLLTLDERWESEHMFTLRKEYEDFLEHAFSEANRRSTRQRPVDVLQVCGELLEALRVSRDAKEAERYSKLFRLCGFFETLGYATTAQYIRVADVHGLLGASIAECGLVFKSHILGLQRQRPGLLENFVELVDKIEERDRAPRWKRWLRRLTNS